MTDAGGARRRLQREITTARVRSREEKLTNFLVEHEAAKRASC